MNKTLERGLTIIVLDYLKRRANKENYTRGDRGDYGEVPLPKAPYQLDQANSNEVNSIIHQLEQELIK